MWTEMAQTSCQCSVTDQRLDRTAAGGGSVATGGTPRTLPRPAPTSQPSTSSVVVPQESGRSAESAAESLCGPLAKALAKLSDEEEEGNCLRPEYHVQSDSRKLDHTKLDSIGLLQGMCAVAGHLVRTDGNIKSYIRHMEFTTELYGPREFAEKAPVLYYDRYISSTGS